MNAILAVLIVVGALLAPSHAKEKVECISFAQVKESVGIAPYPVTRTTDGGWWAFWNFPKEGKVVGMAFDEREFWNGVYDELSTEEFINLGKINGNIYT